MADSVVKLRLDSGEYDAKIKRAAQNVLAFGENCQKAGQSMAKADKEAIDYVRSVGQMETVAKNAKGKINEMTNAFTDLSVQYRKLTEEERQSTFGQALSQSLEQLKARIKDTKEELSEINNELGKTQNAPVSMHGGNLLGGGKLDGMLQVFGGNVMTKAAMWATGLAADMADCVKQGIELAKAGEGIRLAFDRLNRPDLLDKLREATHGTVTDLELMKQAVKFNDFNLSLDEMGTMLAFAQQKAKDTGQSVDYMVDSIVTGLGRKSLMILDNLGLSASEIKDKMAETGDMTKAVGAIIRDQMSKAGDYVETTADRAARADAELKNAMEELGRTFQPLAETGAAMFQSLEIGALNLLNKAIQPLIDKFTTLGRLRREYANAGGSSRVGTDIERLQKNSSSSAYKVILSQYDREIEDRERAIKAWNAWRKGDRSSKAESEMQWAKSKYGTDTGDMRAQLNAWQKMRGEFVEKSKAVMNPVKVTVDTKDAITGVDSLKGKLKELEEQRKKAIKAGDHDQVKNLTQQINQVKGDIKGLDPNAFKVNRHKTTTHKITPQEKAADIVSDAERTYTETLLKNSIRLEAGIDTTLENKKKELSAQERLFDAYSDAYATYKDPKYKESINEAAEKMKSLAKEVKNAKDPNVPEGSLKGLNDKLKELQKQRELLTDPIEIQINDKKIDDLKERIKELSDGDIFKYNLRVQEDELTAKLDELENKRKKLEDPMSIRVVNDDIKKVQAQIEEVKAKAVETKVDVDTTDIDKALASFKQLTDTPDKQVNVKVVAETVGNVQGMLDGLKDKTVKAGVQVDTTDITKALEELRQLANVPDAQVSVTVMGDAITKVQGMLDGLKDKTLEASVKADTTELDAELAKLYELRDLLKDPLSIDVVVNDIEDVEKQLEDLRKMRDVEDKPKPEPLTLEQKVRYKIAEERENADINAMTNLLKVQLEHNLKGIDINTNYLQEAIIGEGMDIPDKYWEDLTKQINAKLKKLGIKPITLDVQTGNVSKEEKREKRSPMETVRTAMGGISQIAGGLNQMGVKLPDSINKGIAMMQGLITAIEGVQTVISLFSSGSQAVNTAAVTANTIAVGALTTAMMANTVTNFIPFFNTGGVAHAAGGLLAGHHFSGDNVPVMVNDGELILNRAQQGVIADALGGGNVPVIQIEGVIDGENLRLVQRNSNRRRGRGEYVTTKTR